MLFRSSHDPAFPAGCHLVPEMWQRPLEGVWLKQLAWPADPSPSSSAASGQSARLCARGGGFLFIKGKGSGEHM